VLLMKTFKLFLEMSYLDIGHDDSINNALWVYDQYKDIFLIKYRKDFKKREPFTHSIVFSEFDPFKSDNFWKGRYDSKIKTVSIYSHFIKFNQKLPPKLIDHLNHNFDYPELINSSYLDESRRNPKNEKF